MSQENNKNLKVISFDMEGTLATPDFSFAVWHEGIPSLYSRAHRIKINKAREIVMEKYDEIGDQRPEWYDIKYWFRRFGLGDYKTLMESCKSSVSYYGDTAEVLRFFTRKYKIIVVSSTTREFLPYLLDGLTGYSNNGEGFLRVFSSTSDYGSLKTPDFYLKVCQELGIEPHEIAHVGDNLLFDYLNPREAGIRAFYLDRIQNDGHPRALKSLSEFKAVILDSIEN